MRGLPGLNTGMEKISDFKLENEKFKISFEDKSYERVWQCYYDWGAYRLMTMIIKTLGTFTTVQEFEKKAEKEVQTWLNTYSGLGLFCSLLPRDVQEFLYRRHRFHEADSEQKREAHNYEVASAKVKAEYEILYDQNFRDLIPKCDIFLDEIEKHIVVDDDMKDERKKLVFVKISAGDKDIEIRFVLEKKKLGDKLVDKAAEVVASLCHEKDIPKLDIPKTLQDITQEKLVDKIWISTYWDNSKEETNI